MPIAIKPSSKFITIRPDASDGGKGSDEAKQIKVISIPFPKKTVGIVFGQMTADWVQHFNTYILDEDDEIVSDPQAVFAAQTNGTRFEITKVVPSTLC